MPKNALELKISRMFMSAVVPILSLRFASFNKLCPGEGGFSGTIMLLNGFYLLVQIRGP